MGTIWYYYGYHGPTPGCTSQASPCSKWPWFVGLPVNQVNPWHGKSPSTVVTSESIQTRFWSRKPACVFVGTQDPSMVISCPKISCLSDLDPVGDGGVDQNRGIFWIFFCAERQRPKQWSQTFQRDGGLSFFHVFNVFLSIFIERMYCLVVSQDSVLYSVLHSFRVTSFSWQFHSQVGQGHL